MPMKKKSIQSETDNPLVKINFSGPFYGKR